MSFSISKTYKTAPVASSEPAPTKQKQIENILTADFDSIFDATSAASEKKTTVPAATVKKVPPPTYHSAASGLGIYRNSNSKCCDSY